jgi:hypothetical protein
VVVVLDVVEVVDVDVVEVDDVVVVVDVVVKGLVALEVPAVDVTVVLPSAALLGTAKVTLMLPLRLLWNVATCVAPKVMVPLVRGAKLLPDTVTDVPGTPDVGLRVVVALAAAAAGDGEMTTRPNTRVKARMMEPADLRVALVGRMFPPCGPDGGAGHPHSVARLPRSRLRQARGFAPSGFPRGCHFVVLVEYRIRSVRT